VYVLLAFDVGWWVRMVSVLLWIESSREGVRWIINLSESGKHDI
jgi:hypothetical protein